MRKGLLVSGLLLLSSGCATLPRQGIEQPGVTIQRKDPEVSEEVAQIRAEIQRYHNWLESRGRLLGHVPHYRGWPEPRQLDPKTLEPLPDPPPATQEEIIKGLNEMLKDPEFRKWLKEQRKNPDNIVRMMPAGSPSPASFGARGGRLGMES
jgi:hypothetical protein